MRFGKRHRKDETPADEPVGIEALRSEHLAGAGAPPETGKLPDGVPDLQVLSSDPLAGEDGPTVGDAHAANTGHAPGATAEAGGAAPDTTRELPSANPYATGTDPILDPEEQAAYDRLKAMRAERRRKKLIRRGIAAGVVVALVAAVGIWHAASSQAPATAVQVVTQPVYRAPYSNEISGSGSIKPTSSTVVAPQISGTIETVEVVAGQHVEEGDTLFTIKNDDLDRQVNEAARNVRKAEQAVTSAKRDLASAKKAFASASTTDAQDGVEATDAASAKQAVDAAQTTLEDAEVALEAAQDAHDQAVEQADQRVVKAPLSGSVIELNAQPGAVVSSGSVTSADGSGGSSAPCQIADLSQMTVTVSVSEIDINKVQVDQAATATFSAVPDIALDATVRSIASTSSSGSDSYMYGGSGVTYAVDLVIPEPDERLKPGMTANVSIVTEHLDTALLVPAAALTDLGDGTGTLTVETNPETHEARVVRVNVLASNGSEAAVEPAEGASLAEGDNVIIAGAEAATITDDGGLEDLGAADAAAAGGAAEPSGGDNVGADGSAAVGTSGGSSASSGAVVEHGVDGAGNPVA